MSTRITGTDLQHWSGLRSAQGTLPAVVRELIMATTEPTRIRFPADEAVARPGLDGVLTVTGDAGPYVPNGESVWEASTNGSPKTKATSDYQKRTEQTSVGERAELTFVFVTSRSWSDAQGWIEEQLTMCHGWKDIRVIEAEDLALWLNTCPSVEAWLSQHLNRPYGIVGLSRWFTRWSKLTDPETPAELLLAGRGDNAIQLLNDLDGPPAVLERCASSSEEVVAFVAATMLVGPDADPSQQDQGRPTAPDRDEVDSPAELSPVTTALVRRREPDELEALMARAVVVETEDAWNRWCQHERPQVLIPLFYPDNVTEAVAAGHHVVLSRVARDATDRGRLAPLSINGARTAWSNAGVDYRLVDDHARASRRNLRSLRRRIARHRRHRTPEWASGPSASLLATTLLAGSWNTKFEGDVEVMLALTDRRSLRSLNRDLGPLTLGDDPPLSELEKQWNFTDVVDAWDALAGILTAEDLELFMEQIGPVLTEVDAGLHLVGKDRIAFSLNPDRPRERYSRTLREGMVTTLAILGSIFGGSRVAGDLTGANVANIIVRDLLDGADGDLWLTLSGLLPLLAEAAPETFMDAVERSLRADDSAVMALFSETEDGFGGQRSHHSPLLWALETLAFSPSHVARVAAVLAKLTELDPGGRLSNRPSESLTSLLHLRVPQGAVDASNRITVIDAVRRAAPTVAPSLLAKLVKGLSSGMLIRRGPRFRNWPTPRTHSTYAEIVEALDAVTDRLLEDTEAGGGTGGWLLVVELIGNLAPRGRSSAIAATIRNWDDITPDEQAQMSEAVAEIADRHRRFADAAWSMSADGVAELDSFLATYGVLIEQHNNLFSWRPRGIDLSTQEGREELERRRINAVKDVVAEGIDGVLGLVENAKLPFHVGYSVAFATTDLDDAVLDLVDSDDPGTRQMAAGLVGVRSQTPGWVEEQIDRRPQQAAQLLLALDATNERLNLLQGVAQDQQEHYWKSADPGRVTDDAVERYVDGLLEAKRLFAAIDAVSLREEAVGPEVLLKVLGAPLAQESIDTLQTLRSPQYEVGRLLDHLEDAGTPSLALAKLEWFYLPLLTEGRLPRALHQRLAREPEFFAEVVSQVYTPDPPGDDGTTADEVPQVEYQFSDACWDLSHDWREPLPGAVYGSAPAPDAMHEWVQQAREALAQRNRAGIASLVIGSALAGRTTDEDGTWPCLAVRTVLEKEQDDRLEDQLVIARLNQRGVTSRGVYDGGKQERQLAGRYSKAADDVRHQWPRAGKILDQIASSYEAEARREDASAERQLRR